MLCAVSYLTFALALVATVIPLPEAVAWLRPDVVTLMLIFWAWHYPHRTGIFTAFAVGLLADVITFGVLGQHALAKVTVVYLTIKLSAKEDLSSKAEAGAVFALLLVNAGVLTAVNLAAHGNAGSVTLWLAPFSGMLIYFAFSRCARIVERRHHGILE